MTRDAIFSDCGQHRYMLYRWWGYNNLYDSNLKMISFIGLNPSTANADDDDATIRRVIAFAKREGYGGLYMLNLFSLVSTDPKALLTHPEAVGPACESWMENHTPPGRTVVFCWGAFPEAQKRAADIIARYPDALCFGKTKGGHPKHPLYLAGNTPLIPFAS